MNVLRTVEKKPWGRASSYFLPKNLTVDTQVYDSDRKLFPTQILCAQPWLLKNCYDSVTQNFRSPFSQVFHAVILTASFALTLNASMNNHVTSTRAQRSQPQCNAAIRAGIQRIAAFCYPSSLEPNFLRNTFPRWKCTLSPALRRDDSSLCQTVHLSRAPLIAQRSTSPNSLREGS